VSAAPVRTLASTRQQKRASFYRLANSSTVPLQNAPVSPGAGWQEVPWAHKGNRHFQIGDGPAHLKLRREGDAGRVPGGWADGREHDFGKRPSTCTCNKLALY